MIATFDTDAPATPAPKTSWTLEEYAARPEEFFYHELVDGQLVEKPMGALAHFVISNLGGYLVPWSARSQTGKFLTEAEFQHLSNRPRTVRIPDGAFVSLPRMTGCQWEDSVRSTDP